MIRDIPYVTGGHPRQKLDLYLPEKADKAPLIIWVHGGAWLEGSKEDGVPLDCLAEGYAVACINYRLSQHAIFPAQIQDCKAAVRWRWKEGYPAAACERAGKISTTILSLTQVKRFIGPGTAVVTRTA